MKLLPEIKKLLETEKLCTLATSSKDLPHLSLMNFTYLEEEGLIIVSSRADTTKVRYMIENPAVAILLHNLEDQSKAPLSCTLYGRAAIVPQETDKERYYREAHHKTHQEMGQFINGENIVIIGITIKHAALSDLEDSVRTWSAANNYE